MTDRHVLRDAVCAMTLESYDVALSRDHGGGTYHFCSTICRERFDREPGRNVSTAAPLSHAWLVVGGMSCGGDATRIEHELSRIDGVTQVTVNPLTETAYASFVPDRFGPGEIKRIARGVGFHAA